MRLHGHARYYSVCTSSHLESKPYGRFAKKTNRGVATVFLSSVKLAMRHPTNGRTMIKGRAWDYSKKGQ